MALPRFAILAAGTALQVCLGTAYAWSWFQKPIADACGWSNSLTAWAFCLAICCLGLSAAWAGPRLERSGPARLAMAGGVLFGLGHLLAALALHLHAPALLILGYGAVGGCGLGLGYVTPVATVARWFPERKGLATGLVIMGFGLGALAMAKLAAPLLHAAFAAGLPDDAATQRGVLARIFAVLGLAFLVLAPALGACLRFPPGTTASQPVDAGPAIRSRRFAIMWLVFFCNITAGIAFIGFQSPLFQELWRRHEPTLDAATLAAYGATLIGISSLCNGLGRLLWGGLADAIGRVLAFRLMLGGQVAAFAILAWTGNPWLFAVLVCAILLSYGGGFGTMPGFVLDVFGARAMPAVYGAILTAWSAAGIIGPQLVALIADRWPGQAGHYAALVGAGFVAVGCAASLLLRDEPPR